MPRPRVLHDEYFKRAKAEGYLARSAYKLLEINERKRLIRQGQRVLDLGCAPGSWLQVASDLVGKRGKVVGIDLLPTLHDFKDWVVTLVGDATTIDPALLLEAGGGPFHVLLSDMAPKTTGAGDHFMSVRLCRSVLALAPGLLKPGGSLAMKVLEGAEHPELLRETGAVFKETRAFKPRASREASRETFIVAKGFEPAKAPPGVTFLAPISALVALAVTLPVLLAFYFLKLRRRPVRVSSTMLWEDETRDLQVNVPLRWLRSSWLLLIQVLALLLLAGALGAALEGAQGQRGQVFVLIDRSASMNATDAPSGGTRLDEARSRAVEAARRWTGSGAIVTLIAYGADAMPIAPPTTSLPELERAIADLTPTDQPGDPARALALVETLAAGASTDETEEQPAERPLVVLISDGGDAGGLPLAVAGADVVFTRVGPAPGAPSGNLAVVAIAASRDDAEPARVRVFFRVQSTEPGPVTAGVTLRLNDGAVLRRTIEVPGPTETGRAGEIARTLEIIDDAGGVITLTIDRPDTLDADNSASAVLGAPSRPALMVVAPDGEPDGFLGDVLSELRLSRLQTVGPDDYRRYSNTGLAGIDLVIFDRVEPALAPARPTLSFGAGMPGLATTPESPDGGRTQFISWRRSHPILRHVALDSIVVGRRLGLPDESEDGRVTALATGRRSPLIIEVEDGPSRRVVVAFPLAQSSWPVHFGFPIFVASAVDYLASGVDGGVGRSFRTTEPAFVLASGPGRELVVRGPIEKRVRVLGAAPGDALQRVDVGVLERAGVYRAEGVTGPGAVVAINLTDPHESLIRVMDEIEVGGVRTPGTGGDTGPREIWALFVLVATGLLLLEWALYAWRSRI